MGFLSAFGPLPAVEAAIFRTGARALTAPARIMGRYALYGALRGPQQTANGSGNGTLGTTRAHAGSATQARLARARAHAAPDPATYDYDPHTYMTQLAQRRRA